MQRVKTGARTQTHTFGVVKQMTVVNALVLTVRETEVYLNYVIGVLNTIPMSRKVLLGYLSGISH